MAGERQADKGPQAFFVGQLAQLVPGRRAVVAENIGIGGKGLVGQAAGLEGHVLHEVLRQALRDPFLEALRLLVVKGDARRLGTGEQNAAAHDLIQDALEAQEGGDGDGHLVEGAQLRGPFLDRPAQAVEGDGERTDLIPRGDGQAPIVVPLDHGVRGHGECAQRQGDPAAHQNHCDDGERHGKGEDEAVVTQGFLHFRVHVRFEERDEARNAGRLYGT